MACTYCNEFDDFSKPVPLDIMIGRLDCLGDLGTTAVAISGGEPLMHPALDDIIAHIRKRRTGLTNMITNGYLLTADRIQRLNPWRGAKSTCRSASTTWLRTMYPRRA